MTHSVDQYFNELTQWRLELNRLRALLLSTELKEEFKWKTPCYTFNGKNVVIMVGLKNYCGLSFFKGVLMKDKKRVLQKPGKNSQTVKILQFQKMDEIQKTEKLIRNYIQEAIDIERAGLMVDKTKNTNIEYCPELSEMLAKDESFARAFHALTPGRKRGYNIYISGSKKPETRLARIEKNRQRIIDGYGIHDCTCGLSKRGTTCDGSHKQLMN